MSSIQPTNSKNVSIHTNHNSRRRAARKEKLNVANKTNAAKDEQKLKLNTLISNLTEHVNFVELSDIAKQLAVLCDEEQKNPPPCPAWLHINTEESLLAKLRMVLCERFLTDSQEPLTEAEMSECLQTTKLSITRVFNEELKYNNDLLTWKRIRSKIARLMSLGSTLLWLEELKTSGDKLQFIDCAACMRELGGPHEQCFLKGLHREVNTLVRFLIDERSKIV